MASHNLSSVNTYMLTAPKSLPSAQTCAHKRHTQVFLMPHTYLQFSVTEHYCPCIFSPVGATSTIQSPVLGVLESPLSFTLHHPDNSSFQMFLKSVSSPPFSLCCCPWVFHHLLPRRLQWPLNWSRLQVRSPQLTLPRICWHCQSRRQWTSITCRIKPIKATMSSDTRALPPFPFLALNTPSSDLWLLPTPPETEVTHCSCCQLCSGMHNPLVHPDAGWDHCTFQIVLLWPFILLYLPPAKLSEGQDCAHVFLSLWHQHKPQHSNAK